MSGFLALLRQRVAERPEAPAILVRGELVHSYESLWAQSMALANQLRAHGVGNRSLVGLHLHKSDDFIVGMLACWMNRAAFVPLEPTLPSLRLGLMAEECDLACVLSESMTLDWLGAAAPILSPKASSRPGLSSQAAMQATTQASPEDLAYVIYSSGSTGRPKGVELTHRGLVNVLLAQIKAFGLCADSQLLWLLSPSFDASQSDIGTALLAGAAIHIEDCSLARDPRALVRVMVQRRITHLDIPPSLLRLLEVEHAPESLQTLVIGGEVCPAQTVRQWARRCRVVNVYGPTEATICTSMIECSASTWQRALIGDPIAGVLYRILNEDGAELVDSGLGELYIGGISLARGYRKQPELSAQRFVVLDGQIFFRSGDRVRVHPGGGLEFVGRVDRQVKHAGVLVAPEEIEAALLSLEGVREVAVGQERVGERSVLSAYCVLAPFASLTKIQSEISERLPASLVPSRWVASNDLPRLLSGKVDFARLAMDDQGDAVKATARSDQEQRLMALWAAVLGVATIDREADFFQLGGDSMAVVELLVAAEEAEIALSVEQIYQHPRLADLAAASEASQGSVARSCEELRDWAAVPATLEEELAAAAKRPARSEAGQLFLTGATGFLGAHVLVELLERNEGNIALLVRASSEAVAWRRLDANLSSLGLTLSPPARARCRLVCGDLQNERMGLSRAQWLALSESIARIYHCAAAVNLLKPLELLAPANIVGCHRIVELMCVGRPKELHYASTLSVFVGSDRNQGVLRELDDINDVGNLHGGYAQSKWAAESFLRRCGTRAGAISYYRFGLLIGDAERGSLSQSDWLALYVRGLLEAGASSLSTNADLSVDLTPIGYAAAAMAYLSEQKSEEPAIFHIANSRAASMSHLHEAVATWQVAHSLVHDSVVGASAVARLGSCRDREKYERLRPCDLFQATGVSFDCRNTLAGLAGSGIAAPLPAPRLVDAYVEKLIEEMRA